jgi:CRP-like cAMP-binding protein
MAPEHLAFIAGCGKNVRFEASNHHEGEPSEQFYLIRHGKVSLEIFLPGKGPLIVETLSENDVLGWSWLFAPYRRYWDTRALEVTRAVSLDGACIRAKCMEDHVLGYDLVTRFAQIVIDRLQATTNLLICMGRDQRDDDTDLMFRVPTTCWGLRRARDTFAPDWSRFEAPARHLRPGSSTWSTSSG